MSRWSGLRPTLALAFGGLLAILLVLGAMSIRLLGRYSATLETIFRENYDTVLFSENMKDAVDALDGAAERLVYESSDDAAARAAAIARFEENLERESRNVTLPGEGAAVEELSTRWREYRAGLERFFARRPTGAEARDLYRQELLGEAVALKATAQHILDMNLANMVSVDGRVRSEAVGSRRAMMALMGFGALVAAVFAGILSRAVLRPVRTLTASVREVARGNLDLEVPVGSADELGELASAFNAMASRLREFRDSDRARLLRTERTTQVAVDTFPDPVAVIGPDGRVELANAAAVRLFGLRPGTDAKSCPHVPVAEAVSRTLESGQPYEPKGYEAVVRSGGSDPRSFQPRAVPVLDEAGRLAGVTLVLGDVTSLRRIDEMKSRLVATASHELKTPLTALRMATHLLREGGAGPLDPRQLPLVEAACEEGDRLHAIVDGLLDMARLETGAGALDLLPCDVGELVEAGAAPWRAALREKDIAWTASLAAGLPKVMADADRLQHVFANLLQNALRHTPAGGRIEARASREGDRVRIEIVDSGEGLSEGDLSRVFERFYRGRGSAGTGSAGLGLAIVQEIVEAHGGEAGVRNEPGGGACFHFSLAVAGDDVPAV